MDHLIVRQQMYNIVIHIIIFCDVIQVTFSYPFYIC